MIQTVLKRSALKTETKDLSFRYLDIFKRLMQFIVRLMLLFGSDRKQLEPCPVGACFLFQTYIYLQGGNQLVK